MNSLKRQVRVESKPAAVKSQPSIPAGQAARFQSQAQNVLGDIETIMESSMDDELRGQLYILRDHIGRLIGAGSALAVTAPPSVASAGAELSKLQAAILAILSTNNTKFSLSHESVRLRLEVNGIKITEGQTLSALGGMMDKSPALVERTSGQGGKPFGWRITEAGKRVLIAHLLAALQTNAATVTAECGKHGGGGTGKDLALGFTDLEDAIHSALGMLDLLAWRLWPYLQKETGPLNGLVACGIVEQAGDVGRYLHSRFMELASDYERSKSGGAQ